MRTNKLNECVLPMMYTNMDLEIDSYSLLCCLDEIGFTYPPYPNSTEYLNIGESRNLREFNETNKHVFYHMIYDFIKWTYGISVSFWESKSISYNERGTIEKVDIEGMDETSDIYGIITNMVFDDLNTAYKTVAHMIVSDLNWRHKQKKEFSKVK